MKKRLAAVLLVAVLVCGAYACSSQDTEKADGGAVTAAGAEIPEEVTETPRITAEQVQESELEQAQDTESEEEQEDQEDAVFDEMAAEESLLVNTGSYQIYEVVMTDTANVKITYPRIEGMKDSDTQKVWNNYFKNVAEGFIGNYTDNDFIEDIFSVADCTDTMISLKEEGAFFYEGTAHPYAYRIAYNLDLTTGEMSSLAEQCDTQKIAECLMSGSGYTIQSNQVTFQDIIDFFFWGQQENPTAALKEILDRYDYFGEGVTSEEGVTGYSYWENGKLNLVFYVNHVLGDYVIITLDDAFTLEEPAGL